MTFGLYRNLRGSLPMQHRQAIIRESFYSIPELSSHYSILVGMPPAARTAHSLI
jgi:hypothetical protein